jgi:hypothetical protein
LERNFFAARSGSYEALDLALQKISLEETKGRSGLERSAFFP